MLHSTTSPLSSDHLSECKVAKVRRQLCQGPNQLHAPLSIYFRSVASRISDLPFLAHQSINTLWTSLQLRCQYFTKTYDSQPLHCTQRVKSLIYMRQNYAIIMQGADIDIADASPNHVAPLHCWLCRTPLMAQQLSLCQCNYQCRCKK